MLTIEKRNKLINVSIFFGFILAGFTFFFSDVINNYGINTIIYFFGVGMIVVSVYLKIFKTRREKK